MYEAHFGLNENPFSSSPSPEFIYESGEHREALAHFRFALTNREAFLLLTGEVGTGKTTAVQALRRLLRAGTPVAVITHTTLEPAELLEEIALKFGLEPGSGESKPVVMRRLERFLQDQRRGGGHALLILDEAHLLAPPLLEEVRLLSNLESEEGGKLLQICLVGQPELQTHLQQPELRQLRQRISVRYSLNPLTADETAAYICHRLMVAGCPHPAVVFPREATQAVFALTQGIPREINVLAGQAMLNAYLDEAPEVSRSHVYSAKSDYGFQGIVTGAAAMTPQQSPAPPTPRRVPTVKPPPLRPAAPEVMPGRGSDPAGGPPPPLPSRRPIPLPPESLRPEAPSGTPVEPEPLPAPELGDGARRRPPARLAAGPGLGTSRKSRSGPRGLFWIVMVAFVVALVMLFGWWQTLDNGTDPVARFSPSGEDASGLGAGGETPRGTGADPGTEPETTPGIDANPGAHSGIGGEREPDPVSAAGTNEEAGEATQIPDEPPAAPDREAGTDRMEEESASGEPAAALADASVESGPVAIQVASFRTQTRADQVLAEVTERTNLPGVVLPAEVEGVLWYRILLGAFDGPEEARQAAEPLLRRRIIRNVVTREIPERWLPTLSGES